MNDLSTRISLGFLLLLAGCGGGTGGTTDQVLATATIGPQGGAIEVQGGDLDGLALRVPAGALVGDVQFRVVRPALARTSEVLLPGDPVRIEPIDQEFLMPAELELPYRTRAMRSRTAPGNVRTRHLSALGEHELRPRYVDVVDGRLRVDIAILGSFEAIFGPVVNNLRQYIDGAAGAAVPLEDGYTFAIEQEFDPPRFPGRLVDVWTVQTPSGGGGHYLEDLTRIGRFSIEDDWQEIWDRGVSLLDPFSLREPIGMFTTIYSPISAGNPISAGSVEVEWSWRFAAPMQVGDQLLLLDLVELVAVTAWDRSDIGQGQSTESFWFAPELGLVALEQDDVMRRRTDL